MDWLGAHDFGELAGISRQKAHMALARAVKSLPWRGARLTVRMIHGRGGRSGLQYEVRLDSLPLDLQQRSKVLQTPIQRPLRPDDKAAAERAWRANLIGPLARLPKGTPEYRQAKRELLAKPVCHPDGTWKPVSEPTLRRWLKDYAAGGLAGITRGVRKDAGSKRTDVTRSYDEATPFNRETRRAIGAQLRNFIKGLRAEAVPVSQIALHARISLMEWTREAGFDPGAEQLERICHVPYNLIWAEKDFRKVARFRKDAKAYHDARPRILRGRAGYRPMDVVIGDVHPVDIYYRRRDGSVATAKAIAWLDLATNRIWIDLVFLEKGKGIRAAHIAASFVRMACEWGMPRALYVDNGSEYKAVTEFLADALKLIDDQGRKIDDIAPWADRAANVINALPYNAPAKPIEGIFNLLEKQYFSGIPGYIAGDRLRKKTANHGREPDPFPGTIDELRDLIANCVALYNKMPQKGRALKGKSPNDALRIAIEEGWTTIGIERDLLRLAFATPKVHEVTQGWIEVKGRRYTSRALQRYQGDRVTVLHPKFEDWTRLPILGEDGRPLGFVEPDGEFGFLDPAGAVESAARVKAHREGVLDLARQAPKVDVPELQERALAALPEPPVPPKSGLLTYSREAKLLTEGLDAQPDEIAADHADQDAVHRANMAEIARQLGLRR